MQEGLIGERDAVDLRRLADDLFADDPVVFKKLIYEMRFDEGSAIYAIFGPFYTGIRLPAGQLGEYLEGRVASS